MGETILDRLTRLDAVARRNGFDIRADGVAGEGTTWCELRGRRTIFLDATQTAGEQVSALLDILQQTGTLRVGGFGGQTESTSGV